MQMVLLQGDQVLEVMHEVANHTFKSVSFGRVLVSNSLSNNTYGAASAAKINLSVRTPPNGKMLSHYKSNNLVTVMSTH